MTKKQIYTALRGLKKELQNIQTFNDYVSISIRGQKLTTALFNKGISKTDMKLILAWEAAKETKRNQVKQNEAA